PKDKFIVTGLPNQNATADSKTIVPLPLPPLPPAQPMPGITYQNGAAASLVIQFPGPYNDLLVQSKDTFGGNFNNASIIFIHTGRVKTASQITAVWLNSPPFKSLIFDIPDNATAKNIVDAMADANNTGTADARKYWSVTLSTASEANRQNDGRGQ